MEIKKTYFIRGGDHIKIGESLNPASRMVELQTAFPQRLRLLKVTDIRESEAHRLAAQMATRHQGEWFDATQELLEWIDGLEDKSESSTSAAEWIAEYERITKKVSKPLDHVEWADMKAVEKFFGLGRTVQYRLIAEGKIRSCSLCDVGMTRGKRLLCLNSVRSYLNACADAAALSNPPNAESMRAAQDSD